MIVNTTHELHAVVNGQKKEIPNLQANQTRVLVGVLINLCHEKVQIITMLKERNQGYTGRLTASPLRSGDIIFRCQHYWWLLLKHPSPALLFAPNLNVLHKLYAVLLPKLRVMKSFPTAMRSVLDYLRGLNLHLVEVEVLAQATRHLISLCEANTLTHLLL